MMICEEYAEHFAEMKQYQNQLNLDAIQSRMLELTLILTPVSKNSDFRSVLK